MKLVTDTLLDAFQFLQRDDLEVVCYATKRLRSIVKEHLKDVSLRRIHSASIYFHADVDTFEVTVKIDKDNLRSMTCRSVEGAVNQLILLTTSAFVEYLSFIAVTIDKWFADYVETSSAALTDTVDMISCNLSLADAPLMMRLIRR